MNAKNLLMRWVLPFAIMTTGYVLMPEGETWERVSAAMVMQVAGYLWGKGHFEEPAQGAGK